MKRWWIVIALLLSVGVNLGILAAVVAGRLGSHEERRPGPPQFEPFEGVRDPRGLSERMGLGEDAARRFRELHQEFFETAKTERHRGMELRRELLDELTADEPDRARIDSLLQEISEIEISFERKMAQTALATRELLDDDDEERYLRFLSSRMMRMGGGRPPGGFAPHRNGTPGPGQGGPGRHGRRGDRPPRSGPPDGSRP